MPYIILFIMIINTTIAYASFLRKKFEDNLILTIVSYITILFLGGIIGNLDIGFYIIIVGNVGLFVYNIFSITKKRIDIQEQILTFGFILFVLSYILILWISIGRMSVEWDEFSHWSLAVKNMFNLRNLGLGPDSNILAKSYLSGTSIFQFFCTRISGEFNEELLYVGMNLMLVSTIIPMFKNIKSRKNVVAYICYFIMFFLPMCFYKNIYISLYVDGILAMIFAYTLYSYYTEDDSKFKNINLMANIILLVFIKDYGLVLAAGCLFIILLDNIYSINKFDIKSFWKNSKYILLTAVPMIFIKIVWTIVLKMNNLQATNADVSNIIPTVLNFIKDDLLPYQKETIRNYIVAILETPLTSSGSLSFIMCVLLAIILAFFIIRNIDKNKSIRVMLALCIIGAFAYAILLMFVPFLTVFSEYEALNLSSYSRYINSYILGLIILELALIVINISKDKIKFEKFTLILLLIFIISFPVRYIEQLILNSRELIQSTVEYRSEFDTFNRTIKENVKNDEKVYFISVESVGEEYYIARYEATPIKLQTGWNWSISNEKYCEGDIWTNIKTIEQWKKELLNDFEYVYLYNVDAKFIDIYGNLFYNKENINNNQLYKINKTENTEVILQLVAE